MLTLKANIAYTTTYYQSHMYLALECTWVWTKLTKKLIEYLPMWLKVKQCIKVFHNFDNVWELRKMHGI